MSDLIDKDVLKMVIDENNEVESIESAEDFVLPFLSEDAIEEELIGESLEINVSKLSKSLFAFFIFGKFVLSSIISKGELRKLKKKDKIKKIKEEKMMPNYFFCVRIFNQKVWKTFLIVKDYQNFLSFNQIIETVHSAQKTIIQNHCHLERAMVKINSLHVTLCAMNLKDEDQVNKLALIINFK
jgi:hypothetical protein